MAPIIVTITDTIEEADQQSFYSIFGEVLSYLPQEGLIAIALDENPLGNPIYIRAEEAPEWMRVPEQIFCAQATSWETEATKFRLLIEEQCGNIEDTFEEIIADLEQHIIPIYSDIII